MQIRKITKMHYLFGRGPKGATCGECSFFVSGKYHNKILRKCQCYGLTHSEASDWAKRWQACGLFNKEYSGRPAIECRIGHQGGKPPKVIEPMEGQIFLFEKEETTWKDES